MAINIESPADYNGNEIRNVSLQNVPSDPSTPAPAQIWYRSDLDRISTERSTGIGRVAWADEQYPYELDKAPTGFIEPGDCVVTYDGTTRTVTLTGDVRAMWRGQLVEELVSGWVSPAHAVGDGNYFLYYDGSTFQFSTVPWTFDKLMIAYAFRDGVNVCLRECHGLMDHRAHHEFHDTIGTYLKSGATIGNFVLNSTTVANRRPSVTQALVYDEDLPSNLDALPVGTYTILNLAGSGAAPAQTSTLSDIIPLSGNRPYWNQYTGGAWTQTLLSNNQYAKIFLMAIPTTADTACKANRYVWIQPQTASTTLSTIEAVQAASVNLGQIGIAVPEYVFVGELIIRYIGSNWQLISVKRLTGTRVTQIVSTSTGLNSVATDGVYVTGSGVVGDPVTVSDSGVVAGTYTKVTVDVKGRVTVGAALSAGDIPALSYLPLTGGRIVGTGNVLEVYNGSVGSSNLLMQLRTTAGPVFQGNTSSQLDFQYGNYSSGSVAFKFFVNYTTQAYLLTDSTGKMTLYSQGTVKCWETDGPSFKVAGSISEGGTLLGSKYTPQSRTITAGTGLTGGGDLTANRTLAIATTGVGAGTYTKVTVNTQGQVTIGATLAAGDIPSLSYLPLSGGTLTGWLEFASPSVGASRGIRWASGGDSFEIRTEVVDADRSNLIIEMLDDGNELIRFQHKDYLNNVKQLVDISYNTLTSYVPFVGTTIRGGNAQIATYANGIAAQFRHTDSPDFGIIIASDGAMDVHANGTLRLLAEGANSKVNFLVAESAARAVTFGSAGDTNLYRGGQDLLRTDDNFYSGGFVELGDLYHRNNINVLNSLGNNWITWATRGTNVVALSNISDISMSGTLTFGGDTDLYRSSANVLRTSDAFRADGTLEGRNGLYVEGSWHFLGGGNWIQWATISGNNINLTNIGNVTLNNSGKTVTLSSNGTYTSDGSLMTGLAVNRIHSTRLMYHADGPTTYPVITTCRSDATVVRDIVSLYSNGFNDQLITIQGSVDVAGTISALNGLYISGTWNFLNTAGNNWLTWASRNSDDRLDITRAGNIACAHPSHPVLEANRYGVANNSTWYTAKFMAETFNNIAPDFGSAIALHVKASNYNNVIADLRANYIDANTSSIGLYRLSSGSITKALLLDGDGVEVEGSGSSVELSLTSSGSSRNTKLTNSRLQWENTSTSKVVLVLTAFDEFNVSQGDFRASQNATFEKNIREKIPLVVSVGSSTSVDPTATTLYAITSGWTLTIGRTADEGVVIYVTSTASCSCNVAYKNYAGTDATRTLGVFGQSVRLVKYGASGTGGWVCVG
jgi:hypothetical protein